MNYKYYKSINFLIAFNYYEIKATGDLRYLLKLEDYEDLPDDVDVEFLKPVMDEIYIQASEIGLKYNRKLQVRHDLNKSIHVLKSELELIHNGLQILAFGRDDDVEKELLKYGYKIDDKKPYEDELIRIQKRSMHLLTKIKQKEYDLKDITPEDDDSDIQESVQAVSDYKGRDIDLKKITVKEWLIMEYGVVNSANKKALKNG